MDIQTRSTTGHITGDDQSPDAGQYAGLSVRIARSADDRQKVFALRYHAYLANQSIAENATGLFFDQYDELPSSQLFAVFDEHNNAMGALRFALQRIADGKPVGELSAPEFAVFADALSNLMIDGRDIASGARFSILPGAPQRTEIALILILAQLKAAKAAGAKWGIATARGTHLRFYRRLLAMDSIGPERPMPGLNYGYTLLASDTDANFDKARRQFPSACIEYFERNCGDWETEIAGYFSGDTDAASRIAG